MFAGPRALPAGTSVLGQAPEKAQNEQRILVVLLLIAAYMNLLLNLMKIPSKGLEAGR